MILIDGRVGSKELFPYIMKLKIPCEITRLEYGDACFSGNGPRGPVTIGIERKTLHDMLACIDDARYSAHQLPGMNMLYTRSFLCLEGAWRPGDGGNYDGQLMQGFSGGWGPLKPKGGRGVRYAKLYRYLISIALSGVIITFSRDICHTAYNIVEIYQYFQKQWREHTSLRELQKLAIPVMDGKPSVVRQWATAFEGIGIEKGEDAERLFKTPIKLATADEMEWLKIPYVGPDTARRIVREINGW